MTFSECVCCCYRSGLDLMRYKPNDNCECASDVAPGFIVSLILLSVSVIASIVSGCYFAGKLHVTPFVSNSTLPVVEMATVR